MSRTIRGSKGPGYDFWSRRCRGNVQGSGRISKHITKHRERQRDREMEHRAMVDPEDFELRFAGE